MSRLLLLFALAGALATPARLSTRATSAPPAAGARPASRGVALPGLAAPVEIVTDRWGIPHVRARNLGDLYEAWGWVTARDRLWQLALTRARAEGAVHLWLGNRALDADGGAQLFMIRERAAAIWARDRRDGHLRFAMTRYVRGVNAYLERCRAGLEPWPPELARLNAKPGDWRPEDSVALLLGLGVTLDLAVPELAESRQIAAHGAAWLERRERFEDELEYVTAPAAAPERHPEAPGLGAPHGAVADAERALEAFPAHSGDGSDRASNEFAVGARRTASGKPILANDPHLELEVPGPFHVVHLVVPGIVDAIGATVPGLPAIVSGRNARCAWGVTALSADVVDAYADTLSADGRSVLWHPRPGVARWRPLVVRPYDLTIRVLGVPLPVPAFARARRYSPHGPVLALDARHHLAISVRWSAMQDDRVTLGSLVGVERADSAGDIAARFRSLATPTINVVAADVDGRVLYQAAGLVPVREYPFQRGVLPGDGRHEWSGYLPPGSLPAWRVPADGFVVNANNRPEPDAGIVRWDRFDWPQDRAARIAQRLAGDRSLTRADAASVQNDVVSRAGERTNPWLIACADSLRGGLDRRARAALDTLRAWDGISRRHSVGETLNRAWWNALLRRSRLEGVPGLALAGLQGRAGDAFLAPGSDAPERPALAAAGALAMALDTLAAKLGPDPRGWTWARAHRAQFEHPLAALDGAARWEPPPTPADGDGSTVCVGGTRVPWSFSFTHAPAFRHVVDLGDPGESWGVVPPWNSERSRVDQRAAWQNHGYVPFLRDSARIAAAALSRVTLAAPAGPR